MGTETFGESITERMNELGMVKLKNPLMGTETTQR